MKDTIANLEAELKRAKLTRKLEEMNKHRNMRKLKELDSTIKDLEARLDRMRQEKSYRSFLNFTADLPAITRNKLKEVYQIAQPGERKITIRCLEGSL